MKNYITFLILIIFSFNIPLFGQLNINPTFTDGAGQTWTAERIAVINQAIEDWESVIEENQTIDVSFVFTNAGSSSYFTEWGYSLTFWLGDDVLPWYQYKPMGAGIVHTISYNVDRFSGSTYSWFDSTPSTDDDILPEHYDMLTSTRQELGHMLGFVPSVYATQKMTASEVLLWNIKITYDGSDAFFDLGDSQVEMASSSDLMHVKDAGSTAGDLMNPSIPAGERRRISVTDLKMLSAAYGYSVDTLDSCLPVELTSFTANIIDDSVILNWETATEINNYGFEILRTTPAFGTPSLQRRGTGGGWEKLGFVPGHGNCNSPKSYEFIDENPINETAYYCLKQIDYDGTFEYSDIVEISFTKSFNKRLDNKFVLHQNYPNPFNPSTEIRYQLAGGNFTSLNLYDILGKKVAGLVNEFQKAGSYEFTLNVGATHELSLPSGVYFLKLQSGNNIQTKKIMLIK